jgi:hypothetical protein
MAEKTTEKRKSQSEKFKETARALGCDESEERFDRVLRTVAKQKPKDRKTAGGKR